MQPEYLAYHNTFWVIINKNTMITERHVLHSIHSYIQHYRAEQVSKSFSLSVCPQTNLIFRIYKFLPLKDSQEPKPLVDVALLSKLW